MKIFIYIYRYLADTKYDRYMMALIKDIVKFINQADVTIINSD